MLVITRKPAESLHIGDNITVSILGIKGNSVRVGVDAPNWLAIRRSELLTRDALGPTPVVKTSPGTNVEPLRKPRKLLIVDDSPADRHLYRRLLNQGQPDDFEITEAHNGNEGLTRCREDRPDCILLDYRLPDLDGIGFLDALQQAKDMPLVPVVMLTGMGNEHLAVQAMKKGACDYLSKNTLTPAQLQKALQEVMDRKALLTCAS